MPSERVVHLRWTDPEYTHHPVPACGLGKRWDFMSMTTTSNPDKVTCRRKGCARA